MKQLSIVFVGIVWVFSCTMPLISGCKGEGDAVHNNDAGSDAEVDAGTDADADVDADGSVSDDAGEDSDPTVCDAVGFENLPFNTTGSENTFGEIVPDFTINTLRGDFVLSQEWGECSVFTLVPYSTLFEDQEVAALVDESEVNNTYVFYSFSADPEADMIDLAGKIDAYLATKSETFQEEWSHRFRYVTDQASAVPILELTGTVNTDYFIIDSRQRLRDAGSFRYYIGGEFAPLLSMVRYAAKWFNYERRLEEKLAAQNQAGNVLVVPWVKNGYNETNEGKLSIALPSAAEMAKYDRVEIVVKEVCEPGSRFPVHYGVCPAWDVGHKIKLCEDENSCVGDEHNQLYRYITGYHSGGWWFEDVSHGLPWFKKGGNRWLRTNRGDFYGTITFYFFDDGEVAQAQHISDARHLIGMGTAPFDAAHNDSFPRYSFTPPPGTVKVVLDARVQGGGNTSGSGCAEFCSHTHEATINGRSYEHTFVMNQGADDCAERAGDGVTAGQFGTWFFDRGSWCPGGPVERWQVDITEAVKLSASNEVVWTGSYNGDDWPPGGGLTATAWLVFYGADGEAIIEKNPPDQCTDPPVVTLRDFSQAHPDFTPLTEAWQALEDGDAEKEAARGEISGVVAESLVQVDGQWKPVFIWPENTLPYTTAASFDSWWRDSSDSFTTTVDPELFIRTRRSTSGFFRSKGPQYAESPMLDGAFGFGNEGVTSTVEGVVKDINTSYTYEVASSFVHRPEVTLRLGSKGDYFVFVDHKLVIESGSSFDKGFAKRELSLDELGLVVGESYDMHIFGIVRAGNPHLWLETPSCD